MHYSTFYTLLEGFPMLGMIWHLKAKTSYKHKQSPCHVSWPQFSEMSQCAFNSLIKHNIPFPRSYCLLTAFHREILWLFLLYFSPLFEIFFLNWGRLCANWHNYTFCLLCPGTVCSVSVLRALVSLNGSDPALRWAPTTHLAQGLCLISVLDVLSLHEQYPRKAGL